MSVRLRNLSLLDVSKILGINNLLYLEGFTLKTIQGVINEYFGKEVVRSMSNLYTLMYQIHCKQLKGVVAPYQFTAEEVGTLKNKARVFHNTYNVIMGEISNDEYMILITIRRFLKIAGAISKLREVAEYFIPRIQDLPPFNISSYANNGEKKLAPLPEEERTLSVERQLLILGKCLEVLKLKLPSYEVIPEDVLQSGDIANYINRVGILRIPTIVKL